MRASRPARLGRPFRRTGRALTARFGRSPISSRYRTAPRSCPARPECREPPRVGRKRPANAPCWPLPNSTTLTLRLGLKTRWENSLAGRIAASMRYCRGRASSEPRWGGWTPTLPGRGCWQPLLGNAGRETPTSFNIATSSSAAGDLRHRHLGRCWTFASPPKNGFAARRKGKKGIARVPVPSTVLA